MFQIIGIIAVFLFTGLFAIIFLLIGGGLKRLNRSMGRRRREVREEIDRSLLEIEQADQQIKSIEVLSQSVRAAMESAIGLADRTVAFLESAVFQVGVPAVLWTLFLVVALPRAARHGRKRGKRKKREPVPPESWKQAEQAG